MDELLQRPVQATAITLLLVAVTFLYRTLHYKRFTQNAHLPQFPSSLLWGHIKLFYDYTKRGKMDRHPDYMFTEMYQTLGEPPVMLVDNWPIVPPLVVIPSHHVAEQISKSSSTFPYSTPKAWSVEHLRPLLGYKSIFLWQNKEWKAIRRRLSPGFAPQHLMTLLPIIVEKLTPYVENLDEFVRKREAFPLDEVTTNLTFDVIAAVSISEDMYAQQPGRQHDLLQFPWWMAPLPHLRRYRLGERISQRLREIVRRDFADMKAKERNHEDAGRLRTVVALSLQHVESLTPDVLEETCDQIKTFFFAGQDTTSAVLIWTIYELSRTPHVLTCVQDELDMLFGKNGAHDPAIVCAKLLEPGGDELIHRMRYISAVLKEVMRLHPPAGSMRWAPPGAGFVVSTPDAGAYNLDGCWLYLEHNLIQRDRAVYGDSADDFVPERWLSSNADGFPVGSWRAFERGPRNCMGQELANIELRVIVAILAQRYEFTKVGLGEPQLDQQGRPMIDDKGQFKVKSELYNTFRIASKPVDGMMMKVKLASPTSG
ncbi:cytochrome P450 monooxygenase [Apiospora hydei]|uniref:Cytochrome P450 monooxygenase n=1 Tax=Apiospora hydei TaxID=1337664 RepID=A0ABR1UV24_9PEZI